MQTRRLSYYSTGDLNCFLQTRNILFSNFCPFSSYKIISLTWRLKVLSPHGYEGNVLPPHDLNQLPHQGWFSPWALIAILLVLPSKQWLASPPKSVELCWSRFFQAILSIDIRTVRLRALYPFNSDVQNELYNQLKLLTILVSMQCAFQFLFRTIQKNHIKICQSIEQHLFDCKY